MYGQETVLVVVRKVGEIVLKCSKKRVKVRYVSSKKKVLAQIFCKQI